MPITSYRNVDSLLASVLAQSGSTPAVDRAAEAAAHDPASPISPDPAALPAPEGADQPHAVPSGACGAAANAAHAELPIPVINDIYMVGRPGRARPMAFVEKVNKETGNTVIALKRLDWKALTLMGRFRARLLAFLGSEPPRKHYLNAKEIRALRLADARHAPESELMTKLRGFFPVSGNGADISDVEAGMPDGTDSTPAFSAAALSMWASPSMNMPPEDRDKRDAAPSGLSEAARYRAKRFAALEAARLKPSPQQRADTIVSTFEPRVVALRAKVRQLHQPVDVELRAEYRMLMQMRARVEAQCDRFALDGGQKATVLRRLRLNMASCLPPQNISLDPEAPAASLLSERLARMECSVGNVRVRGEAHAAKSEAAVADFPVRDPALASKRDIVLGEIHGDWMLLLHALVQAGFIRSKNDGQWQAMWELLNKVANSGEAISDENWRTFQHQFQQAVELQDDAGTGRRLTLAGNLVGPPDAAGRMLSFMRSLTLLGLNFDCLMGREEYDLVRHTANRGREGHEADSLAEPSSHWLIRRLKLVSCSRDGTVLYAPGFISREALERIAHAAGVPVMSALKADVGKIDLWFHAVLRDATEAGPAVPPESTGLNDEAFRMIQDLVANERFDPASLKGATSSLPHPAAKYVVHAGRDNIWTEVASLHHRIEGLQADMEALAPLFLPPAGIAPRWNAEALKPLTAMLHRLDDNSFPEEIEAAGNLLALAMCHEPALLNHKDAGVLAKRVIERNPDTVERTLALESLARIWNDVYPGENGQTGLAVGKLTERQQIALFEALSSRWAKLFDKQDFRERLGVLAAQAAARTDLLRSTIRTLAAPETPDQPRTAVPGATSAAAAQDRQRMPAIPAPGAAIGEAPHRSYVPALSGQELRSYLAPLSTHFHSLHNPARKSGQMNASLMIHALD